MTMQEPKVEVVEIDLKEAVVTASTGGGQYCTGSMENAQSCSTATSDTQWIE